MKICPVCHRMYSDEDLYCVRDGNVLVNSVSFPQKKKRSKTASFFLELLKCFLFLLLFIAFSSAMLSVYLIVSSYGNNDGGYYYNIVYSGILIVLFLLFWLIYRLRRKDFFSEVSFTSPDVRQALIALLIGILLSFAFNIFSYLFMPAASESESFTNELIFGGPLWMRILSVYLLTPLVEETLFRGVIFSRLRKYSNFWIAALISAVIFGAMHGESGFAFAFIAGIMLASFMEKTGSIWPCILFHIGFNGIVEVMDYFIVYNIAYMVGFMIVSLGIVILLFCYLLSIGQTQNRWEIKNETV